MKTILICLLLLNSPVVYCQFKADETQINKLIDELVVGYNTHDFTSLKNNSTDDVNWVNIVGMWWKGRDTVLAAHYSIFNTIFKGVKVEKKSSAIRSVTKDVAIANVIVHVGEFYPPDGINHGSNKQNSADNNMTLVYVNKGGKWLLTTGQNTVVDANATPPRH